MFLNNKITWPFSCSLEILYLLKSLAKYKIIPFTFCVYLIYFWENIQNPEITRSTLYTFCSVDRLSFHKYVFFIYFKNKLALLGKIHILYVPKLLHYNYSYQCIYILMVDCPIWLAVGYGIASARKICTNLD